MRKILLACLLMAQLSVPAYSQSGLFIRSNPSTVLSPVTGQSWVFNSTNNRIFVWNGSQFVQVSSPQGNFEAVINPTNSNDNTQGFQIGSFWINTNSGGCFVCTNATTSSAVWLQLGEVLTQTFLTSGVETGTLPNSLQLVPGNNITLSPSGNSLSIAAPMTQTILTQANETATLPASFQLQAGANITLTPTTNVLTIASSGGGGGGYTFGADGVAGVFSSASPPTQGPGNSQNYTSFTIVNTFPFQTQTSVAINATGAVAIDDALTVTPQTGGPSQGCQGGGGYAQTFPFGTGSIAPGGGGGGGNGGQGGQGGSGSIGSLCNLVTNGGYGGAIANFNSFSGSVGGFCASNPGGNDVTNSAGGTIIIAAVGAINVSGTGSIVVDAPATGAPSGCGGGSAGTLAIYSQTSINIDGTISGQGGAGSTGTTNGGDGGAGDGGAGGGAWVVLVAPVITGTGLGSINVNGGTATTGNTSSHVAAFNGGTGQVLQVIATPTLPLCQRLEQYANEYGLIADIQGKTILTPTARLHKVTGKEIISFMAAREAKNTQDFDRLCDEFSTEHAISRVATGDTLEFVPAG